MDILSKEEWAETAKVCLGRSVDIKQFCIKPLNSLGGFLGEHFLASVTVRDEDQSQKALNFFVKGFPNRLPSQRLLADDTNAFRKEVDVIRMLFPRLKSALVDSGRGMDWSCKCFYTRPDVIVLEDLIVQGYRTVDNRGPIDLDHASLALTILANQHSASIIYEETEMKAHRNMKSDFPILMEESFYKNAPNHLGCEFMSASVDVVWALVEEIYGKKVLNTIQEHIKDALFHTFELQKSSKKYRNVVSHGDCKRDNIMYRYENGKPVEAKLVDFQMLRYTPPSNDVMSYLYIATDRAFREKYMLQLLKHYHDHFSSNLELHGLNTNKILSWEMFKESCEFYKTLGLTLAPICAPFVLFKANDIEHVFKTDESFKTFLTKDRVSEVMHAFRTDTVFNNLLSEVVKEFIEEVVYNKTFLNVI